MKGRIRSAFVSVFLMVLLPNIGLCQAGPVNGGSTLLSRVTDTLQRATAFEYTSVVRTVDSNGQPITFYVHAKLRKPGDVHLTVSTTSLDAPDALLVTGDSTTITAFDPQQNRTTHAPSAGAALVLPFGLAAIEPALTSTRQILSAAPFSGILPNTERFPLTLSRHAEELPGALRIAALWDTDLLGQQQEAKMWVTLVDDTPRRLLFGDVSNGAEQIHYVEDFTSFTLNPTFPDDVFRWMPPIAPKAVVTEATPAAPPAKAKAIKAKKAARKHTG